MSGVAHAADPAERVPRIVPLVPIPSEDVLQERFTEQGIPDDFINRSGLRELLGGKKRSSIYVALVVNSITKTYAQALSARVIEAILRDDTDSLLDIADFGLYPSKVERPRHLQEPVRLPAGAVLKVRLRSKGIDSFVEKSELFKSVGGKTLCPCAVVQKVDVALYRHPVSLPSQSRSIIVRALLEDYPITLEKVVAHYLL